MERGKPPMVVAGDSAPKIKWKKIGGGSFRLAGGRIIKPGQIFSASEKEIPVGFRDVVTPLDPLPPASEEVAAAVLPSPTTKVEIVKLDYQLKARGSGWYDVVVNPGGKVVNERGLHHNEAVKLIEDLSSG